MCHISRAINPQSYERETRSVRLNGYVTSMGLEEEFWTVLQTLAGGQDMSIGRLLTVLYDEYAGTERTTNFTSFLRVSCIEFVRRNSLVVGNPVADTAAKQSNTERYSI